MVAVFKSGIAPATAYFTSSIYKLFCTVKIEYLLNIGWFYYQNLTVLNHAYLAGVITHLVIDNVDVNRRLVYLLVCRIAVAVAITLKVEYGVGMWDGHVVTKSDRWVSSRHSGFLPHEDHPNANIGDNEHD